MRRSLRCLAAALAAVGLALLGTWSQARPQEREFSTAQTPTAPTPTAQTPTAQRAAAGPTVAEPGAAPQIGRTSAALPNPVDVVAPVNLRLEELSIQAQVVPVGVDDRGQVAVPADGSVLGWYRWSSPPGAPSGSSVLTGHVDTRADGPGALFHLADVGAGQRLSVELSDGSVLAYEVVARQDHLKADLPVAELFARDGPPRLVLITCGGEFDEASRRYAENVVVTAVPVR